VIVQVRDTMSALDERLALRGYAIETATDLLIAPASTVRDRCGEPAWPVLLHDELDDVSIDAYGAVMGTTEYAADRITAYGRMMRSLGPVAFAATVSEHDVPIGVGFGVVERGWIGYYGIATSEHARRRGVSTAIMRALTERAIAEGATNAYLQVDAENNGAQTMYARQGFTRSYGYHYRTKQ
jgi:ribosomal protein S18 acetylase RimI-like enzyme